MSADAWAILGEVPPLDLVDAALEVHWAAQLLASTGQTFVEPRPDDSHRAMTWAETADGPGALLGEPFSGVYPFQVALDVAALTLQLRDGTGAALGSLPLPGETLEYAYAWLRDGLTQFMGGPPEIGPPDFEIPPHPVATGAPFAPGRGTERAALAALYGSAARLLTEVSTAGPGGSPVRCWPHHFDIATLLTVREAEGTAPGRTVGVGMAPMGGGYDRWYWYVTPWPYPPAEALPTLAGTGHWHTEGWVGAVLSGDEVVHAAPDARSRLVEDFVQDAVGASIKVLSTREEQ